MNSVAEIFKRVAAFVKMDPKDVAQVSGHSIRVGATQDLLARNIDLASVMQAGRWKSNRMPMRYGERVLAAKGGMARAAAEQGRDSAAASADMLAPTPQMGFNNWYSTFCRSEFNEEMIRGVADKMVTLGLKDAGYMHGGPRTAKRLTFNTPLMGGVPVAATTWQHKVKGGVR